MPQPSHALTAILPCNDLDASEAFYTRLGFTRPPLDRSAAGEDDSYRMLADGRGGALHLTSAVEGWLIPGRNPFGLYLYTEDVDVLAAEFPGEIIERMAPRISPGACTNSPCRTRTRRWRASAGRPGCGQHDKGAAFRARLVKQHGVLKP